MKSILVPVDFLPVTELMMEVVTTIATACRSRVYLLHVAPELSPELKSVPVPQQRRDLLAHVLRDEHRTLQRLADRLREHACEVEALMVEGRGTIEKIVEEAGRLHADLIIVGSHGEGRLSQLLLGSTCQGVLRKADVPVLIVPAPDRAKRTTAHASESGAASR